ncbi:MAG TPA: dTDP-4-dehydrorhamnose 3,5-epimerase [Longimicrobiaceae bacterium]|nr:dTDP-4-dehydrorhamnose 3,5-epimerase [Longimicrobiaceae bacterium]
MNVLSTELDGVLLFEPKVIRDERGQFFEAWNEERYRAAGLGERFVQDNVSWSRAGVLRGLHYQHPHAQGKLVTVLRGEVFDVAVDVRRGSPMFGRWAGFTLSAENGRQLWIPPGFAHGFVVTGDEALFSYKCSDVYHPEAESTVAWDDPELGIRWPVSDPVLSAKDRAGLRLRDVPPDRLPAYPGTQ